MDFEIYPLSIPQCDWQTFSKVCQSTLGFNPIKSLDKAGLDIKDSKSFLRMLDLTGQPLKELKDNQALDHFSISFIADVNEDILIGLLNHTELRVLTRNKGRKILAVISGSLRQWQDAIIQCCQKDREYALRLVMSKCRGHFESSGYAELWSHLKTQQLEDGTLIFY